MPSKYCEAIQFATPSSGDVRHLHLGSTNNVYNNGARLQCHAKVGRVRNSPPLVGLLCNSPPPNVANAKTRNQEDVPRGEYHRPKYTASWARCARMSERVEFSESKFG